VCVQSGAGVRTSSRRRALTNSRRQGLFAIRNPCPRGLLLPAPLPPHLLTPAPSCSRALCQVRYGDATPTLRVAGAEELENEERAIEHWERHARKATPPAKRTDQDIEMSSGLSEPEREGDRGRGSAAGGELAPDSAAARASKARVKRPRDWLPRNVAMHAGAVWGDWGEPPAPTKGVAVAGGDMGGGGAGGGKGGGLDGIPTSLLKALVPLAKVAIKKGRSKLDTGMRMRGAVNRLDFDRQLRQLGMQHGLVRRRTGDLTPAGLSIMREYLESLRDPRHAARPAATGGGTERPKDVVVTERMVTSPSMPAQTKGERGGGQGTEGQIQSPLSLKAVFAKALGFKIGVSYVASPLFLPPFPPKARPPKLSVFAESLPSPHTASSVCVWEREREREREIMLHVCYKAAFFNNDASMICKCEQVLLAAIACQCRHNRTEHSSQRHSATQPFRNRRNREVRRVECE
jgi:hypothetical protein